MLTAFGLAVYWWRARRKAPRRQGASRALLPEDQRIIQLYRQLEDAMAAHGIVRTPDVPPLAHARALRAAGHPVASEVYELTRWYLSVRFGDTTLDHEGHAEFARRVAAVKQLHKQRAA